ncbi:MAG: PAS domain S-box protein [Bacteroidota bacterium]
MMDEKAELELRLQESEDTLRAIRQYLVDAFVIQQGDEEQVITLGEADFPYRVMMERMNEGAVTLISDGTIFYSNPRFAEMIGGSAEKLIGTRFQDLITPPDQGTFQSMFAQASHSGTRMDSCLQQGSGPCVPVQLSLSVLADDETMAFCVIVSDITERQEAEQKIRSLASELTIAEQEERHRISQVLHDDLQQRLFAIKAQLSFVGEAIAEQGRFSKAQTELNEVQSAVSEAIYVTRNLSVDLSPVVLHGEGLPEAIAWLGSQMKANQHLEVNLYADADFPNFDRRTRVMLFQAIRELLFNIIKHSGTLKSSVEMSQVDGNARIVVSDEGSGFDVPAVLSDPERSHGLSIIQDRLNLRGWNMQISSQPGQGTRIIIHTPLERAGVSG